MNHIQNLIPLYDTENRLVYLPSGMLVMIDADLAGSIPSIETIRNRRGHIKRARIRQVVESVVTRCNNAFSRYGFGTVQTLASGIEVFALAGTVGSSNGPGLN